MKEKEGKLPLKSKMLGAIAGLSSLLLFTKPSQAILADLLSIFSSLEQYFPEVAIVNEWAGIITSTIADPCSGVDILAAVPLESGWCSAVEEAIEGDLSSIIASATGELGIPNPLEIQQAIKEASLTEVSDSPFISNPHVFLEFKQNIADRGITKLNLETVLGTTGQQNRQETLAQASEKVEQVSSEADHAQSLTSTQDVLKSLVQIQAMDTMIAQMYHQDQYLARNDRQFTNLNLTNISRTLDADAKVKTLNRKGNAAQALYWSAQVSLF